MGLMAGIVMVNHANFALPPCFPIQRLTFHLKPIFMETKMSEANTCGCGRSPTGKCCGWHNLSEEQYAEKKAAWEAKQAEKKAS